MASNPSEVTPQKVYRLMAAMALAMMGVLAVAIYNLARLNSLPWSSPLSAPVIQADSRQDLPQFELASEGELINPAFFEEKWTLLSFWSVTCPPCVAEIPSLNQLYQNWQGPGEFLVLTVNSDTKEDRESARSLLQEQQIVLPTVYDGAEVMKKAFGVREFPRHFLIDPSGKIIWSAAGAFDWNSAKARDQLLKLMELRARGSDSGSGE